MNWLRAKIATDRAFCPLCSAPADRSGFCSPEHHEEWADRQAW
jgi:hypothetical protein